MKLELQIENGPVHHIRGEPLGRLARKWSQVVANRGRWIDRRDDWDALSKVARDDLSDLNVPSNGLFSNSGARFARINYQPQGKQYHQAVPWEFLLALACPKFVGKTIPCLRNLGPSVGNGKDSVSTRKSLFVQSCPGEFSGMYTFNNELESVQKGMGADPEVLTNPSIDELANTIEKLDPAIIHMTGIDSSEGRHNDDVRLKLNSPGFYLSAQERAKPFDSKEIASVLTAGAAGPEVVVFDCYNSGLEIAREVVAEGAGAAIGFLDTFEDPMPEQFIFEFYQALRESGGDTRYAYLRASEDSLTDLGTVFWHRGPTDEKIAVPASGSDINLESLDDLELSDIEFDIEALETLNYCSLHNKRSPFKYFSLRKKRAGKANVKVQVSIDVGRGNLSLPYTNTFSFTERRIVDLRKKLSLPLIWNQDLVHREAIRSQIQVEVSVGEDSHVTGHETTLLPFDEWKYGDESQAWLPSFVLPRDMEVSRIVEGARKYLPVLFDDWNASFDGYQAIEMQRPSSGRGPFTPAVDLQVRALWSFVSYDVSPSYVNPPPSYTDKSQRLRFPKEVIQTKRGTCIDLALLFAACLEYIEIYPAIFLLEGHAFCGYWRSPDSHDEFRRSLTTGPQGTEADDLVPCADRDHPWALDVSSYEEVVYRVNEGELVPLESTMLCRRESLNKAMSEGLVNLRSKTDFVCFLDIESARDQDVRPLPLVN